MIKSVSCIFYIIFLCIFSISANAQTIIWSEDFNSYPNGTNNLNLTTQKWWTDAHDADDGGINNDNSNYWGVYDGEFRVNDIEGRLACTVNGYGGNNDNFWYSQVIDVSAYSQFSVSMKGRAMGDMECASATYGCNAADLLEGSYQIDGEDWVLFFSMCGSRSGEINSGCVQVSNGHTLKLRIQVGNQAQSETYFFDDIRVTEVPIISGAATVIRGSDIMLGVNATGGTWRSSDTSIATVDATGKVRGIGVGTATIFYVTGSGCEVNTIVSVTDVCDTPTNVSTTPASRCGAGTLLLAASFSSGTLSWYSQASGGTAIGSGNSFTTPSITNSTSYYVQAVDGTCVSSRIEVRATINEIPTMTSTTPASRCGAGTLLLAASFSSGTLSWYSQSSGGTAIGSGNSFTTPSITNSTSYYVEAINGTCVSLRIEVRATVNEVPTMLTTHTDSRCGTGALLLGASFSNGTLSWYSQATGGTAIGNGVSFTTPSITNSTSYYVQAVDGTCVSSRIEVRATINQIPTMTTNGDSRCGPGVLTLQATSAATLSWYSQASGGTFLGNGSPFITPSLTTSTSYYVETSDGICTSSRVQVTATVNQLPTLLTKTSNSRCGNGVVTLKATFSVGTLSWYSQPSAGTSLGNGETFTTPSIAGTTSYYVQAANGACISPREELIATVNEIPTIVQMDTIDLNTIQLSVTGGVSPYTYILRNQSMSFIGNEVTIPNLPNGTYRLVVTDQNNCRTDSLITIYRPEIVLKPEPLFSPNGDNINDTWEIENIESYPLTEVFIHDRFGKELKSYKASAFIPWDGYYLGQNMPSDDYWYVIKVIETGRLLIGHFSLKR